MKNYIVLGIFLLLISTVYAVDMPSNPEQFYGSATINGKPADSVFVIAKIADKQAGSGIAKDGKYGYAPNIFVVKSSEENKTIEFFLQDLNGKQIKAGEAMFRPFMSTKLDLDATGQFCGDSICQETCSSCSKDCGACPPPPGNNNGNTKPPSPPPAQDDNQTNDTDEDNDEACTPNWICTDWNECSNGRQQRACVDSNKCGMDEGKPEVIQSCVSCGDGICQDTESCVLCSEDCKCGPTGLFFDDPLTMPVAAALVVVILILLFEWYRRNRKNKTSVEITTTVN